jgi:hypothetical protein
MSRCLAIFHNQFGVLVLLEPTLKRLSRVSGSKVDLITGAGFQPLISLMPHVGFRRTPSRRAYHAVRCFYNPKKSALYALRSRASHRHLLINPGAPIQWYRSKILPTVVVPDLGRCYIAEYYWRNTVVADNQNFKPPELKPKQRQRKE